SNEWVFIWRGVKGLAMVMFTFRLVVCRERLCKVLPHRHESGQRHLIRNVVWREVLDVEDLCEVDLQRVRLTLPPPSVDREESTPGTSNFNQLDQPSHKLPDTSGHSSSLR